MFHPSALPLFAFAAVLFGDAHLRVTTECNEHFHTRRMVRRRVTNCHSSGLMFVAPHSGGVSEPQQQTGPRFAPYVQVLPHTHGPPTSTYILQQHHFRPFASYHRTPMAPTWPRPIVCTWICIWHETEAVDKACQPTCRVSGYQQVQARSYTGPLEGCDGLAQVLYSALRTSPGEPCSPARACALDACMHACPTVRDDSLDSMHQFITKWLVPGAPPGGRSAAASRH